MDDVFEVLSDSRRREILKQLAGGERSAGDVHRSQPAVTFGAISQHLKVLERAGLVQVRRAGRNRFYQANLEALLPLRQWLDWMWDHSLDRLKQLAEAEAAAQPPSRNLIEEPTDAKQPLRRKRRGGTVPSGKIHSRARPRDRRAT